MKDIFDYPLITQKGLKKQLSGPKRKSFGYQVLGFGSGGAKVPVVGRFLLIAGGGGGLGVDSPVNGTAGGGGGGVVYMANSPNASDAVFFKGANPIVIGSGGAGSTQTTSNAVGVDSTINLTAAISAGGGSLSQAPNFPNFQPSPNNPYPGGAAEGGSGSGSGRGDIPGGEAIQPQLPGISGTSGFGNNGGPGNPNHGSRTSGGGGGAGGAGGAPSPPSSGPGGAGKNIPGAFPNPLFSPTTIAGGGGSGVYATYSGSGGSAGPGGGGAGNPNTGTPQSDRSGTANTGGGGGGGGFTPRNPPSAGGNGGSGLALIRIDPGPAAMAVTGTGNTVSTDGSVKVAKFVVSGTLTL